MAGYIDAHRDRYSGLRFRNGGQRFFKVIEGFPRLTRSTVPSGVKACSYTVDTRSCEPFEIDPAEVRELIRGVSDAG